MIHAGKDNTVDIVDLNDSSLCILLIGTVEGNESGQCGSLACLTAKVKYLY